MSAPPRFILWLAAAVLPFTARAVTPRPRVPVMGWSSWNQYRINIDENLIRAQADAMAANGMKDAGYTFINVDDGYFGGRDGNGNLVPNNKFPSGMRTLSDYIHGKGLKAGIYSDAGSNTCGSQYDGDTFGIGSGLYGHEQADLTRMLQDWNYDFIKVDWCGGANQKLSQKIQYTKIGSLLRGIKPAVVFNVCCWQYPGDWVRYTSDSWRISGDINSSFASVMSIMDQGAPLWVNCSPGHFNDMDMLQVGRGMTADEDKAHFTMWCMLNSPLLAGNDLTTMTPATLAILTNREVIALDQDLLCYQARRLRVSGLSELWAKPLGTVASGDVAVALLNRDAVAASISFNLNDVGVYPNAGYTMRDLWAHQDLGSATAATQSFSVPAHGVVVLRVKGTAATVTPFTARGWTYDAWCVQQGLTGVDANPTADPDHDGVANLLEYALDDGDPLVPNPAPLLSMESEANSAVCHFSPRLTTDVQLIPQVQSNGLGSGQWSAMQNGQNASVVLTDLRGQRLSVPFSAGSAFFRLVANLSSSPEGVTNPSFESPAQNPGTYSTGNPNGWTFNGLSAGVENISDSTRYGASGFGNTPTKLNGQGGDGDQVGYVNLGDKGSGFPSVSVDSAAIGMVNPNTTYTLTIAFAQRSSGVRLPDGTFGLRVNGTNVGTFTAVAGSTMTTGFHDLTFSWTSPDADSPLVGQFLTIRMDFGYVNAVGGWQQAQFDRVRFAHSP